jgi:tetratricopeptide (TPR) repeat protein
MALQQLERMADGASKHVADRSFMGWWRLASLYLSLCLLDDPAAALAEARQGQEDFSEAGDRVGAGALRVFLGLAWYSMGALERALAVFEAMRKADTPAYIMEAAESLRCHIEIELDDVETAIRTATSGINSASADVRATCEQALARAEGEAGRQEAMLNRANASLALNPPRHARARGLGIAAEAYLALGDPASALKNAAEGAGPLEAGAVWHHNRSALLLVRAEALMALGREDEAREAIKVARDRLLRIHATVPDDLRAGYLTGLRAHRRTMELAHEWLADA